MRGIWLLVDLVKRYRFGKAQRLHGKPMFDAVYGYRVRKEMGVICVFGKPNGLGYSRLGLSVGKRFGNAVRRNGVKRLLRESFRLCCGDFVRGYDLVVVVRPHDGLCFADYQRLIFKGIGFIDKKCAGAVGS